MELNSRETEKSCSPRSTPIEKGGGEELGMIVPLESFYFQVCILDFVLSTWNRPIKWPKAAPSESAQGKGRNTPLPKQQMEACLLFFSSFFLSRSSAKEEITSPFLLPTRDESPGHIDPSLSLSFPVNKIPFVHAACLLAWIGVGILALPSKGYCQFIKRLFILWGSAGREVQVTRRRVSSVCCVPHKSAKSFSLSTGYLASVLFDRGADRGDQSPLVLIHSPRVICEKRTQWRRGRSQTP